MQSESSRRQYLFGLAATLATACAARSNARPPDPSRGEDVDDFAALEGSVGGRIGVFALDTATGRHLGHRADERFTMCSTFKWVLAAAILADVDRGALSLAERIPYREADILDYAPATRAHASEGAMSIDSLAGAAVMQSDNTAANLLLAKIGGPAGFTRFCRANGDSVTRLDRNEPALNTIVPGDVRDTTSPRAMVGLMQTILRGKVLTDTSRERLVGWLVACETGKARLRAGLPPSWNVGDKTGTGETIANDVAIAFPPERAPILIASYMSESHLPIEKLNGAHAQVGRIVAERLAAR